MVQAGNYLFDNINRYFGDFYVCLRRKTDLMTGEVELTATVLKYEGCGNDVVIPSTFDGYVTAEIGYQAFFNNQDVVRLRIPATITHISEAAFAECKNLTKVWVIETFTHRKVRDLWLSDKVFYNCEKLSEFKAVNKEILCYAASQLQFGNCVNLIVMNTELKYIRQTTLSNCQSLERIIIADGGYLEHSVLKTLPNLKTVAFMGSFDSKNMSKRTMSHIAKLNVICYQNSNATELAYLGANIQIINQGT
jgi:hypothetical protein